MRSFPFICFLALFILISCTANKQTNTQQASKQRPNIVFLLADDLGYGELGSYGQEVIQTPFLDELAAKGLRFTDFYAGTAVCSPSRAVLMTGKHAGHSTIRGNKGWKDGNWTRIALQQSELTLAEMLKNAGYVTGMVGKWHLGDPDDLSTWAYNRGFDYAVQEQWSDKEHISNYDERVHWVNEKQDSIMYDYTQYSCLDEFRTNLALDFLEKKEDNKAFFLYMSYRIPHAHEYYFRANDLYKEAGFPENERMHAARITLFDQQVKRLYDALEASGELDNTLIVFTSDNGPTTEGNKVLNTDHDEHFFNSSGGLKGHKRDLYEGGIRVPCFAVWQGKIQAGLSKHPATFYDLMPTFAELAQTKIPTQTDGISFLPELLGQEQPQHEFLYWEIHNNQNAKGFRQAVRIGKWKAVRYGDDYKTELYNLEKDLFEEKDVAADHPEILAKANAILKRESVRTAAYEFSGGIFE